MLTFLMLSFSLAVLQSQIKLQIKEIIGVFHEFKNLFNGEFNLAKDHTDEKLREKEFKSLFRDVLSKKELGV